MFSNQADMSPGRDTGELNVKEVLNTNVTLWTCQVIVNGVSEAGPISLGTGYSAISYISFGAYAGTTGYIRIFNCRRRSRAVDAGPAGGGLFGLLCYAWRKRR